MKSSKLTFYEGSVSSEKLVVILDIGNSYTKFGFSGEAHPRYIIPTTIKTGSEIKPVLSYNRLRDLYDNLVQFIYYIYFNKLIVSPKDRKVVIVESLLSTTDFRETLSKVLFNHFEVSAVLFVSSHMVSLYPLALNTALVLDIGYEEAVLIPVFEGYPILHAYQAQPLASRAIESNIRSMMVESYKDKGQDTSVIEKLSESVMEDIKVRLCFVTSMSRANSTKQLTPPPSVEYPIQGMYRVTVDGKTRESACEVLFQLDGEEVSLATMLLDALLKCPIDMRKPLANNILLVGGTSMIRGIKSRILAEIKSLMQTPKYKDKLFLSEFKIHKCDKPNTVSWFGGSIVGACELVNLRSITREEYLEKGKIPDWVSLIHNIREENIIPSI